MTAPRPAAPGAAAPVAPIAAWWWYSCLTLAWCAVAAATAVDLYHRHVIDWPEDRMRARGTALGWFGERGALLGAAMLLLALALAALLRRRPRWRDAVLWLLPTGWVALVTALGP